MTKSFAYVGPPQLLAHARTSPPGTPIATRADAVAWFAAHGRQEAGWATYVVDDVGTFRVAPRRSEHVACAGGASVQAAGELRFDATGGVHEVSNNSTGYCPREDCWEALRVALDNAGVPRPEGFTFVAVFRRCPSCGERNLVKEHWYVCALCDASLPQRWNFDPEDT